MEENKTPSLEERIQQDLEAIANKIQKQSAFRRFIFGVLRLFGLKNFQFNDILDQCFALLASLEGKSHKELLEIQKKTILLESSYKRKVLFPNLLSGISYLVIGSYIARLIWDHRDSETIWNEESLLYIIGFSGTILFYTIKIIQGSTSKDKVARFLARMATTLVVCFVLLNILGTSTEGQIIGPKGQTYLLYFTCGYSIEVIITLLNKLIEKANEMIKAF
ncbi:MAG: hypothetical protein CL840_20450 [Crocinitomicaceae bacterium]|nr:hypothetical protein [Crocinitomicaceae bacterium]|tara:strand:- start:10948 stop:11610 length:663 start_codon:yes stop_codon:yes gene_type:complete